MSEDLVEMKNNWKVIITIFGKKCYPTIQCKQHLVCTTLKSFTDL